MTPVLVERYAKDGSEKARRQMLALCQTDPDILADVLGHLVEMASQKLNESTVRFDFLSFGLIFRHLFSHCFGFLES